MGRLEVSCRRLAVLSGVRQDADSYAVCIHPSASSLQRKGTLALLAEPAGRHPSLGVEGCRLAQSVIIRHYYADHSLSLTSSLLNALDEANSALLHYNYSDSDRSPGAASSVAVRAGGVQTRQAKVGLSAVLLRPDGEGIYLAHTAPTQVYIRHNGLLSAIPQTQAWSQVGDESILPFRRSAESHDSGIEDAQLNEEVPAPNVTSPALGSAPGAEADLVFRRVQKGDLVVMVSSSLAGHLDRDTAESIFSSGDADSIIGALYSIATQIGLAEAHACVLEIGVEASSGVETDYSELVSPPNADQVTSNGGVRSVPPGPTPGLAALPNLKGALKGSREWLSRKKHPSSATGDVAQGNSSNGTDADHYEEGDEAELDALHPSKRPTETLFQRSIELPPYRVATTPPESENPADLEFDGWEDTPPVLRSTLLPIDEDADAEANADAEPAPPEFVRAAIRPKLTETPINVNGSNKTNGSSHSNGTSHYHTNGATRRPHSSHAVPTLFDPDDSFDGIGGIFGKSETQSPGAKPVQRNSSNSRVSRSINSRPWTNKVSAHALGQGALRQVAATMRSLLPERQEPSTRGVAGKNKALMSARLPIRLVIGVLLALAGGVLLLSVLNAMSGQKQNAINSYLEEAKRLDLLANQPSTPASDKHQNLNLALEKAREALTADPTSTEARLLVAKIEGELDKVSGITRLANTKLLFDLDEIGKTPQGTPAANGAVAPAMSAAKPPVTSTLQLNEIVVQSNDAYILDREKSQVYRCRISTRGCMAILSAGDNAGGQKVGTLIAMTLRVGTLVALDSKLVTYVYDADKSAWQAQSLGDADKLQQPKDISTYDGNLYLLGSKPSQVSKYVSGRYEAAPDDWIKDAPSAEQVKNPAAIAIDGSIYLLLQDGKIIVMEGGKAVRTIEPKPAAAGAPTDIFTSTDVRDLYVVRAAEGTVTRISKEGQVLATYKPPSAADRATALSGVTVDEGKGKIYLMLGRQVYEATLPAHNPQAGDQAPSIPGRAPAVKPIAEP